MKDRYTITDHDIQLFLEIVEDSRRKLVEKFPEVEFHVILRDRRSDNATYLKVRDGLKERSIRYHLISDILPGYYENYDKYIISPYDEHPNPVAYQLMAEYVVNNIMGMKK